MENMKNMSLENIRKFGKYEMGKYQENWKHGKFKKCEIGNMENVKKDDRNKRGSFQIRSFENFLN